MPTAKINDVAIYYETLGQGLPCLVMHGGLGLDHTYLRPWLDPLGEFLQLVYYDHRGNGRSGAAAEHTMTHEQLASDAESLCAYFGFDTVAVIGHSYGGFIALEFALRYSSRVDQLVLIDTAPAMSDSRQIEESARRQGATDEMIALLKGADQHDDASLRQRFAMLLPLYFRTWDEVLATKLLDGRIVRASGRTRPSEVRAYDVTSRLGEINIPTLVLAGRDDFICPPEQARILAQGINQAELAIFEESGHFPFVEQSSEFLSTVGNWLNRRRYRPAVA